MMKLMKAGLVLLMFICAVLMITTTVNAQGSTTYSAASFLKDAKSNIVGVASFSQDARGLVHVNVVVSGLKPGLHGIHIHEKGACFGPAFTSAGEHYNPLGKEHGLKNPKGPHAGDLPNLEVGADGKGRLSTSTNHVTLSPGPITLFTSNGTALVIHDGPDDQMSNPAGDSGTRIACGIIEKK